MSSNLARFLLARITEDEIKARQALDVWGDDVWEGMQPESVWFAACFEPERILAECDAKRRIVEREINSVTGITYRRKMVLQDLAAVYAAHLDYRPEWAE